MKCRRRLAAVARRHEISGPTPVSSTRISASGTTNGVNAGGPTETLVPVTACEISGNSVTQKITKVIATSTMFCSRNIASREISESSRCSERSTSRRQITSPTELRNMIPSRTTNGTPSVEAPNAWIESSTPERTRNVPKIASVPNSSTSDTFQTFSIPRFSWIWIEWMNAVHTIHGISAAFSTASQPQ